MLLIQISQLFSRTAAAKARAGTVVAAVCRVCVIFAFAVCWKQLSALSRLRIQSAAYGTCRTCPFWLKKSPCVKSHVMIRSDAFASSIFYIFQLIHVRDVVSSCFFDVRLSMSLHTKFRMASDILTCFCDTSHNS